MSHNKEFQADPLAFMRKYALNPVNDLGGRFGSSHATNYAPTHNPGKLVYGLHQMGKGDKTAYLNFKKRRPGVDPPPPGSPPERYGTPRIGAMEQVVVSGSYEYDEDKVRAYWLPWQGESITELKIPKMNSDGKNRTRFFFTACINGCSVFIKGDPRQPTVYHAGGNTQHDDPNDAAAFWRDMLQSHAHTGVGPIMGEVNKTQYVLDKVTMETKKMDENFSFQQRVNHGTALHRGFRQWLEYSTSGKFVIEEAWPEGCVMGIRANDGNWTFYLQENVVITYYALEKKSGGLFSKSKLVKLDGSQKIVSRPMQVTQFYPGSGHTSLTPTRTTVLK